MDDGQQARSGLLRLMYDESKGDPLYFIVFDWLEEKSGLPEMDLRRHLRILQADGFIKAESNVHYSITRLGSAQATG